MLPGSLLLPPGAPGFAQYPPLLHSALDRPRGAQMMLVSSGEERCCLRRGRAGGGGLWSCLVEPTSEKEAQSFLPSFLGWLRESSTVPRVWLCGCDRARMRAAFRGWEGGGLDGRVEGRRGWVCVLEEGRPRTGSPA